MLQLGWLQPLDQARLPNVTANLLPRLRASLQDPGRRYTVPWQCGFTGIAYNANLVPEVRSYRELLTRDDLHGRITLLEQMVDTMPAMLRVAGADPRDFGEDEWQAAIELLVDARRRGQIRAFNSADFPHGLARGDIAACLAWATNVLQIQEQYPHLRFMVPEEGMELWADCMVVPNRAAHKANAERWIDHYYEPEVAVRLLLTIRGVSPVVGAREAMERIDPRLAANPFLFPSDELLAKTYQWMPLGETQRRRYLSDFAQAVGA
jgi:spermidine/putrescine transport system substrate-binding protein